VALLDVALASQRAAAAAVAARKGLFGSFAWVLADDLRRPGRAIRWRMRLRRTDTTRKTRRQLLRHAGRLMLATRRRVLVPRTQSILHHWKMVHVPFTFILAVATIVHVALALKYSM
jgi:hypothetical protein